MHGAVIYGNASYPIPSYANETSYIQFISISSTAISISVGTSWANLFRTGYVEIEYMKTTD